MLGPDTWMPLQTTEIPCDSSSTYLKELQHNILASIVKQCFSSMRCADLSKPWTDKLSKRAKLLQAVSTRLSSGLDSKRLAEFLHTVDTALSGAKDSSYKASQTLQIGRARSPMENLS